MRGRKEVIIEEDKEKNGRSEERMRQEREEEVKEGEGRKEEKNNCASGNKRWLRMARLPLSMTRYAFSTFILQWRIHKNNPWERYNCVY